MLKIEDLKAGDELECINRDGYLSQEIGIPRIRRHILSKPIIVLEVTKSGVRMVGRSMQIPLDSLKYFKKKEQSQYTFDDLIDVAVQAYKDGILSGLSLDNVGTRKVSCWSEGFSDHAFDQLNDYKRIIDSINALYKETFVIESEEDIKRIRSYPFNEEPSFDSDKSPKAILSNGNVIHIFREDKGADCVCVYMRNSLYKNYLDFEVLKGATVEQSRND